MKSYSFAARVKNIAVSAIKQMPLHARAVPDAVSLGQGIPSVRTPAYISEAVSQALREDDSIGKYTLQPGLPALKSAIAKTLQARLKRPVDSERELFISAGAMEALLCAIVSIVEEGDEVILFDPSYASHIEQVLFAGGVPRFVPLVEETGWSVCFESLRSAINSKTKAIIVCNPSNPTGKIVPPEDLRKIAELALEYDLFLIADETYDFLIYGETPFLSLTDIAEISDRVIACYSFSKQFAMTGWRVGYMFAPAPVIEEALKVHDATVICAPAISQYAALAALTKCPPGEEDSIKQLLAVRRELICKRLSELSGLFSYVKPEGAYYVLPKYHIEGVSSFDLAMDLLHNAKVITIPGRAFGPTGEGHIRLSYGGTESDINLAFDRITLWNNKRN